MTVGQFFSILWARWWVVLSVLAVVVAGTVGVSLLIEKKYTATASVVIDAKPDPVSAMLNPGAASPAYMATQVDIIQSERVSRRVVRNLKLDQNPQVRTQWQEATDGRGTIEDWLGDLFQRSMEVKPSRESNVITVSYKSPDPKFAAALANAFVQAYIDTTLELRVDPAKLYSNFFDTRSKEARDGLERAQAKLSDFQQRKGIIANDERLDIETARLNELSTQLVALQAVAAESQSRQAQVANGSADKLQEVMSNPLVAGLKTDISRQEARLQELSARYGDNHPQVVESKASLTELRTRLKEETGRATGSVGVTASINRQREGQIRAALDAQRAKVLQLKQVRDEGAVLARDVESAQRTYDAVLARLSQTNLESQTTQSNVNLLTTASPPLEPSSPRLTLNALVAVLVGTMLAVGAALLLELMDRRVRTLDDITASLGLPVIGMMPKPSTKRLFGRGQPSLMQQRVLGRLPAPGKTA